MASVTTKLVMNMFKSKPISIWTVTSVYKQHLQTVYCTVSWSIDQLDLIGGGY